MDFSDSAQEAAFRDEVRAWIGDHAPTYLDEHLSVSGFGSTKTGDFDTIEEAKKWQKKKAEAGWACIQWPEEYGGRGASPWATRKKMLRLSKKGSDAGGRGSG